MFEAIWSALDFWQRCGLVLLAVAIPAGAIAQVLLDRDAWPLYWAELKQRWSK